MPGSGSLWVGALHLCTRGLAPRLLRSGPLGAALLAGLLLASSTGWAAPDRFDVVVIDAGHGGHDEGATGPSGLAEKDLVLDIARRLSKRLGEEGVRVVLTRNEDRFLSLEE